MSTAKLRRKGSGTMAQESTLLLASHILKESTQLQSLYLLPRQVTAKCFFVCPEPAGKSVAMKAATTRFSLIPCHLTRPPVC